MLHQPLIGHIERSLALRKKRTRGCSVQHAISTQKTTVYQWRIKLNVHRSHCALILSNVLSCSAVEKAKWQQSWFPDTILHQSSFHQGSTATCAVKSTLLDWEGLQTTCSAALLCTWTSCRAAHHQQAKKPGCWFPHPWTFTNKRNPKNHFGA